MLVNKKKWLPALAIIFGLWTVGLASPGVPLYDGIGFPDEPYRYVSPPTSAQKTTSPPTTATFTTDISQGTNSGSISAASQEQGPQVSLYISSLVLSAPSRVSKVTILAMPYAPDGHAPSTGQIAGNFYRFTATSNSGDAVTFNASTSNVSYVDLRLPQGFTPGATINYRNNQSAPWTNLPTEKVGNDIYQSVLPGFGDFGLVSDRIGKNRVPSHRSPLILATILLVIFELIILSIIAIRLRKPGKRR